MPNNISRVFAGLVIAASTLSPLVTSSGFIPEDDPRWDCGTMGNHVCGPDIVMDRDGQLRDCTVTDSAGNRVDLAAVCDEYWTGRSR
ncbi:hypothetical protein [Mycobacterium attenuatum]|uniref:hypothetical protein n=1 Tax=Mycobacterium attenuatum TaxID=2341086 RepID=UPI000F021638|nr:hypothetical protein [Mycobacterium attenuatum]